MVDINSDGTTKDGMALYDVKEIEALRDKVETLTVQLNNAEEDFKIQIDKVRDQVGPIAIEETEDGYGRCRFCGVRGDGEGVPHAILCVMFLVEDDS